MNKAWTITWAIIAVIAVIGIAVGATHQIVVLGIALGFIAGEYAELQAERKARQEQERRKLENVREAGRK